MDMATFLKNSANVLMAASVVNGSQPILTPRFVVTREACGKGLIGWFKSRLTVPPASPQRRVPCWELHWPIADLKPRADLTHRPRTIPTRF
jgi:hypothetical protein